MNSYIVTKTSNQRTVIDNNSSYKKDKENSIFFHLHLGKNLIIQPKYQQKIKKIINDNHQIISIQIININSKQTYSKEEINYQNIQKKTNFDINNDYRTLFLQLQLLCSSRKVTHNRQNQNNYLLKNTLKESKRSNDIIKVCIISQKQYQNGFFNDFSQISSKQINKNEKSWLIILSNTLQKQKCYEKIYKIYINTHTQIQQDNLYTKITNQRCTNNRFEHLSNKTYINEKNQRHQEEYPKFLIVQNLQQFSQILEFQSEEKYQKECKLEYIMFKTQLKTLALQAQQNLKKMAYEYSKFRTKGCIKVINKYLRHYYQHKNRLTKKYFILWSIFTSQKNIELMNNFIEQTHFFQDSFSKKMKSNCFYAWKQFAQCQVKNKR